MNAQTFLDNFTTIAEAPGGIARLRRMVLDLAVEGRLVEQDPNDQPAVVDLELIARRREAASQEMSLRRAARRLPPVGASPTRAVPHGWAEVRLGDAFLVVMGNSPPGDTYNEQGQGLPLINGPVEFSASPLGRTVVKQYTTAPTRVCKEGDLLVCVRGATTGRTNIAGFDACIGRGVALVRAWEAQPFVNLLLWNLGSHLLAAGKGTTFPSISQDDLAGRPILVPPLAEQERIVMKVDELMRLCDDLEARQAHRHRASTHFRASALHALTEAENSDELRNAWGRLAGRWPDVISDSESLDSLRTTILTLGVEGRLTRQDPTEEPAAALLARVEEQRRQIWGESGRSNYTHPTAAANHVIPLLAHGWELTCLEAITDPLRTISYGILKPGPDSPQGVPVVKVKDIKDGRIETQHLRRTSPEIAARYQRSSLLSGDVLVSIRGTVGKVAVVPAELAGANITQDSARLALLDELETDYLVLFLRSEVAQDHFRSHSKGAAVQGLNIGDLRPTPVPIPPKAEQRRIVERVGELLELWGSLRESLAQQDRVRRALVRSAANHLVRS